MIVTGNYTINTKPNGRNISFSNSFSNKNKIGNCPILRKPKVYGQFSQRVHFSFVYNTDFYRNADNIILLFLKIWNICYIDYGI